MSFMAAVRREIRDREPDDPVRLTLEYLLQENATASTPVTKGRIVQHLREQGVRTSGTHFQQTVLAESRAADFFIGSNHRGYFLIKSVKEARAMNNFYERRIAAERTNRKNLRRQARLLGWSL